MHYKFHCVYYYWWMLENVKNQTESHSYMLPIIDTMTYVQSSFPLYVGQHLILVTTYDGINPMRWFLVFVMPDSSTFKNVGGQANIVVVVYVSDPNGQLIPSQVAEYALHIGRISSLKLSWQRDDPPCCNMCHGRGAHKRTLIHLCLWNDVSSEDSDFVNVMFVESLPHAVYDWLHTLKCNRNMPCPSWMKHSNEIIMWLRR